MQIYPCFDAEMVQPLLPREAAHKLAFATTGCCQSQWWMLLICLWPQLDAAKAAFPGVWPPVDAARVLLLKIAQPLNDANLPLATTGCCQSLLPLRHSAFRGCCQSPPLPCLILVFGHNWMLPKPPTAVC